MRTIFKISGIAVVALCGALQVSGQNQGAGTPAPATDSQDYNSRPRPGKMEKASKLIGKEVMGANDKRLGTVRNLAVDLKNGEVVEVIIGSGGVLGVDEKLRAVPPGELTCDPATKTLLLKMDEDRFQQAPSFKSSDWKPNLQRENVIEVYKYYGASPYFASDQRQNEPGKLEGVERPGQANQAVHPAENQKPAESRDDSGVRRARMELGEIDRAERIIGMSVHNPQGDRIGKVENLIIDLPAGRVVEVVIGSGGFLGLNDELSAVPPQSFRGGNNDDALMLDTTKEALANAPHFKSSEWESATSPDQVENVYRTYKVEPYFNTAAVDNTAQNVRDRNGNTLTPLQQGTSEADMETTRQIRKAIVDAGNFSVDAQNIKIITLNGHVTLRGLVKSQDEKRRIGDIAATITPATNIDNQLEAESGPRASSNL